MQVNKFFYGLFVCAALCACSNDDVSEIIPDDTPKVFTGDEAYISVRLSDAGSIQSRATSEDPGYEYGNSDEHSVANAYFYFYDANGVFVSEGSAWNGGTPSQSEEGKADGNIEFKSKTVVVLKGLNEKNYPKYMVTVLNRPSNFAAPSSLQEMEKALSDKSAVGIQDENSKFVMSTTSFKHDDSDNLANKYFATEVKEANFSLEPITEELDKIPNPVTVYVERLATKVTLKVSNSLTPVTIDGKTGNYYKVKATVAGEDNSGSNIAAEDLYVELLGWKLNATAKHSNIVKNINESWTDQALGFTWNKPSDFRSFWGKSFNYGNITDYTYPKTAANYDGNKEGYPLDYVTLNNPLSVGTDVAYCAENTNTSAIVSANFPSAVTSILLKARVCDEKGNALDLVRFNGVLFKKTSFIEYILNVMKAKGNWNVWIKTSEEGIKPEVYREVGTNDVELVDIADGKVKVQLTASSLYSYNPATNKYVPMNDTEKETVDTNLATECTNGNANGYKGGLMYYNIPIEHLNNSAVANDGTIPEAKYGVVRNHHYVVTINKLENIGKGIYNPDEVIVPGDSDDDKKAYYVGANINILSWKIVSQDVEL